MRFSMFGNSSPNALMRVNPRAARFMNAARSGPNRSRRALANQPRSLVLSAEPATMNELPKAPLWLVFLGIAKIGDQRIGQCPGRAAEPAIINASRPTLVIGRVHSNCRRHHADARRLETLEPDFA